jgi:hypothetical protein
VVMLFKHHMYVIFPRMVYPNDFQDHLAISYIAIVVHDYKNLVVYQCCTLIPISCETYLNAMMSNFNVPVCAIPATQMQTEKG